MSCHRSQRISCWKLNASTLLGNCRDGAFVGAGLHWTLFTQWHILLCFCLVKLAVPQQYYDCSFNVLCIRNLLRCLASRSIYLWCIVYTCISTVGRCEGPFSAFWRLCSQKLSLEKLGCKMDNWPLWGRFCVWKTHSWCFQVVCWRSFGEKGFFLLTPMISSF